MRVNLQQFLNDANITETLYPGKRIVKPCKQIGEFKNHCVVVDWRDPNMIKLEVRPGLSGKTLAPVMVKNYPMCLQTPTSVKIEVINDNKKDDDDEDEEKGKGKSSGGGGGKKPAKKKLDDIELIAGRFSEQAEGVLPDMGEIKEMVVMGVELAKEAFKSAFAELTHQISHAKVSATELLSKAKNIVTRVNPPEYIKPKGDETANYNYDRERNADIGIKMTLG